MHLTEHNADPDFGDIEHEPVKVARDPKYFPWLSYAMAAEFNRKYDAWCERRGLAKGFRNGDFVFGNLGKPLEKKETSK